MTSVDRKNCVVAELRGRAENRKTITYGEMGAMIGLASQGPWKVMLDGIAADERAEGRPDLACLVVRASTGFPGYVGTSKAERQAALAIRQAVFAAHQTKTSAA
ncbi:hypothetical protein [Lichenifustis flavocetrariae]|uniref:Uncharacterized protein n=1 Tax=Lichenifustis flavocetrariae TaxID=2949735 RepID=A0AA41YYS4_9HYPH|nr:hypothetical protein [Lichenifustis flavocetrariae]MCW6509697.1 hypothetical protein [Lichenifustis flavocetrariae]